MVVGKEHIDDGFTCPGCGGRNTLDCGDDKECHDCGKTFFEMQSKAILDELPITRYVQGLDISKVKPGFQVVDKSVVHVWMMEADGENGPVFTQIGKLRSVEWAKRVVDALNAKFPGGKVD